MRLFECVHSTKSTSFIQFIQPLFLFPDQASALKSKGLYTSMFVRYQTLLSVDISILPHENWNENPFAAAPGCSIYSNLNFDSSIILCPLMNNVQKQ